MSPQQWNMQQMQAQAMRNSMAQQQQRPKGPMSQGMPPGMVQQQGMPQSPMNGMSSPHAPSAPNVSGTL